MASEAKSKAKFGIVTAVIAGLTLGGGTLVSSKIGGAEGKQVPAATQPPQVAVAAGHWATSAEVQTLAGELRGYREEVQTVLKRLHDVEMEQAEARGEARGTRNATARERGR